MYMYFRPIVGQNKTVMMMTRQPFSSQLFPSLKFTGVFLTPTMVRCESLVLIRQIDNEILFCVKNLGSYINVSVMQLAVPTTLWNTAISVIHGDSWWTYYSYILIRSVYRNIFNHAADKTHHVPTNVTKQTHCAADYLCEGDCFISAQ